MIKFAYNNVKNCSTSYTSFELNRGFYLIISYKEDINLRSKLKIANKLAGKLSGLISVYRKNF